MEVYLIDGTYELFRHYYAVPSARDQDGREVAAVRGVLASVLGMIKGGATHVAVATDHVIESFRNQLWHGYKTGDGIDPDLLAQFPLLEEHADALLAWLCGRWWNSRRTMRWLRRRWRRIAIRGWTASSSARRIRTSRNACAALVWSS